MLRTSIFALAVFLFSFVLLAQETQNREPLQKQNKQDKDYVLSVDVDEVVLSVAVLDKEGRPVDGLSKDQFTIFEDNTQQQIKVFKHEDIPLSLGLVIDNSGSMRNKRERVNSAALAFVRESNPEDETFIVNFDDSAYLEQDFTGSIGDLIDALDNLDTRGETALYDAVYACSKSLLQRKPGKLFRNLRISREDRRTFPSLWRKWKSWRRTSPTRFATTTPSAIHRPTRSSTERGAPSRLKSIRPGRCPR